jgi:hypothetical protein
MTIARPARLFFAGLLVAGITAALAQPPPEPAAARDCSAPEYRQFDFKLGSFDVSGEGGGAAGRSTVESALGGCMLVEHWHSVADRYGRANMYYDRSEGRWHLDFVSDDGETLRLQGKLEGEAMVLTGDDDFDPFTGRHRMTWSPLPQGDVRQFWELSKDGGLTWTTVFVAHYARRP